MGKCDFDKWATEVRDPAQQNCEGEHVLRCGRAEAVYLIAPVPEGWTWKASTTSGYSSSVTPWNEPLPTRSEALDAALSFLRWNMSKFSEAVKDQYTAPDDARRVFNNLSDGLFGFIEPDPMAANARASLPPRSEA